MKVIPFALLVAVSFAIMNLFLILTVVAFALSLSVAHEHQHHHETKGVVHVGSLDLPWTLTPL